MFLSHQWQVDAGNSRGEVISNLLICIQTAINTKSQKGIWKLGNSIRIPVPHFMMFRLKNTKKSDSSPDGEKYFVSEELFLFFLSLSLFWHLGSFLDHDFPNNAWSKLTMRRVDNACRSNFSGFLPCDFLDFHL
jgi:hypothetical protein